MRCGSNPESVWSQPFLSLETLVDSLIVFSPSCVCTVQRGFSSYCSTFLMLRLMSFFSDQRQFSDIRRNYKPWDGKQFCSLSRPVLFRLASTLSFLQTHTQMITHTHTDTHTQTTPSSQHAGWLISLGLWSSAWERVRRRKWKREEKQWCTGNSEEATHIEGVWYPLLSHLFGRLSVCSVSETSVSPKHPACA